MLPHPSTMDSVSHVWHLENHRFFQRILAKTPLLPWLRNAAKLWQDSNKLVLCQKELKWLHSTSSSSALPVGGVSDIMSGVWHCLLTAPPQEPFDLDVPGLCFLRRGIQKNFLRIIKNWGSTQKFPNIHKKVEQEEGEGGRKEGRG